MKDETTSGICWDFREYNIHEIINIRVFFPRAGLSLRTQAPRLQFWPKAGLLYVVDMVSVIFRSAFAHDTLAPPQASWCGGINYNSRSHLEFLKGKVNSVQYIAQVVKPVLLPFLRQEGDVFFQQDNARPHTAAATQHVLRVVQQLP